MRILVVVVLGLVMMPWSVGAHPGRTDACAGHQVHTRFEYVVARDGTQPRATEPGEYHYHFAKEDLTDLHDFAMPETFNVNGVTYTQAGANSFGEATLRCNISEDDVRVGIVRFRRD